MPNEMAMAVPNRTSSPAAASATKRSQIPRINVMPRKVSAIVAAQARNGIVNAGMKELTFAVASKLGNTWAKAIRDRTVLSCLLSAAV